MSHFRRRSVSIPQRIQTRIGLVQQANEAVPLQDVTTTPASPQAATLLRYSEEWQPFLADLADNMKASPIQREDAPLLLEESESNECSEELNDAVPPHTVICNWQLAGLYTTHTLSMWNNRTYEFAAVLFITSAYPHTLTIASLRGLTANLASVLFSPAVGSWCNRHPSRLIPLQLCIIFQRICISFACLGWTMIVQTDGINQEEDENGKGNDLDPMWLKHAILASLLVLGMLEKLSWVGNLVVVERDWVPILANDTTRPALHVLNANVKRIDLISKLVAPLAVSGIALWLKDLRVVAFIIAAMQGITVGPEVITAMKVWQSAPALQSPKNIEYMPDSTNQNPFTKKLAIWSGVIRRYLASSVCIPSIAWTIQPLSVLTLSASMMVYLLSINFPLEQITIGRTLSTGVEISSTIFTPLLISWLRRRAKTRPDNKTQHLQPLITVGFLGLSWQLCMLVPAVVSLFILPTLRTDPTKLFPVTTKVLLVSLGLSRLGPFAYALVEQQLVQVAIPPDRRLEFSGTEMALFSFAELCRWSLTAVFGKPEQFKGVAVVSFGAIMIAALLFWWWTWKWKARLNLHDDIEDECSGHVNE